MERIPKRPMLRRQSRRIQEFTKKNNGVDYKRQIKRFNDRLRRRNNRITNLLKKVADLKIEYEKKLHAKDVLSRRELRKKDTLIRREKKKYKDFQQRKGIKHRTVIYKYKYKTYEKPSSIKSFEKVCLDLKDNISNNHLETFEKVVKLLNFLEKYNLENKTNLSFQHYLLLLVMLYSKSLVGGITAPKIVLPQMSPHMVRKGLTYLAEIGLLNKPSKTRFQINLLGEEFLENVNNEMKSYKSSDVLTLIEKMTGLKQIKTEKRKYEI